MAVSRALRRLLRVRDLEEEQSQLALESALGELRRLEHALAATAERDRRGRRLVEAGVRQGQLPDRLAGIEETRAAVRHAAVLEPKIESLGDEVTTLREEFLARRVERRQAETLIAETEAEEAVEAARVGQQSLDDWFRARKFRKTSAAESAGAESVHETHSSAPGRT